MLTHLKVRDLVLIEELDLPLSAGLNVLTGETGAGKSLVAAAVHLLLGRKAGSDVVRRGAEIAEVEGIFDVSDEPGVRARLAEAGLPDGNDLLVRRVIPAEGRQRCFVNGRLASLALLAELAGGLASFASQHEHHHLLDPARQLDMLDAFGGLGEDVSAMARAAAAAAEAKARRADLRERESDRESRLDYLSFQLEEIDALSPGPDEIESIGRELDRLRHLEQLHAAAHQAAEELYEADGSVYERLSAHARAIEKAARHDEALAEDARALEEAADLAGDAARRLADYAARAEADPEHQDELTARHEALGKLVRKHGTDLPGVLARRDEIESEVRELSRYEAALSEAEAAVEKARERARACAARLTGQRRKAARRLEKAARAELGDLAFGDAKFAIRIDPVEGEPGPTGADAAEFLVSLNPGEGAHALRKVASGGELSRLMLGLRRALAGVGPVGTYVFDEVDAGIGGAVASAVGRKLAEVAEHHQVVCVTHLPQIAGLAGTHYSVRKRTADGRTFTEVRRLDDGERVEEIARMLGGEKLTGKTMAAARELLG